jgi:hypothetical protein
MRALVVFGLATALAACGSSAAPVDETLARDLELVGSSSTFELAPSNGGTQVMSALEQGEKAPTAAPAPSPERKPVGRTATQPRSPRTRTPQRAPEAVAEAPAPRPDVVVERPAPAPAPVASAPAPQSAPLGAGPAPPGGWKSVGEVIRNSRIPITP